MAYILGMYDRCIITLDMLVVTRMDMDVTTDAVSASDVTERIQCI